MVPLHGVQPESREPASFDIILVEDDEAVREMITACIKTETTYGVLSLANGVEILKRFQEIQAAKPRLFILDLRLPTITGLQLYETLHACKGFEHIPAIIMTAATIGREFDTEFAKRNLTLLSKPFNIAELLDRIERLLTSSVQLI